MVILLSSVMQEIYAYLVMSVRYSNDTPWLEIHPNMPT